MPTPNEAIALAYLLKLTTYDLVPLPKPAADQIAVAFATPDFQKVTLGQTVRSVTTKSGDGVAIALVIAFDPTYTAVPDVFDALVKSISGGTRTPQTLTLAGRPAAYFSDLGGIGALLWLHRNYFVTLYAKTLPPLQTLGTALITANN